MLSRELYDKYTTLTKEKISGISFGLAMPSGGVSVKNGLPCYNSYTSTKRNHPSALATIILPSLLWSQADKDYYNGLKDEKLKQQAFKEEERLLGLHSSVMNSVFFSEDTLFKDIINSIYEHSYKDWCSFEEFKQLFTNTGIVVEHSLIDEWCPATIMTMFMIYRDGYHYASATHNFESFRKTMQGNRGYLSSFFVVPLYNYNVTLTKPFADMEQIKPIYTKEELSKCPDPYSIRLLTTPIKDVESWYNSLDVCSFLIQGTFSVSYVREHPEIKFFTNLYHSTVNAFYNQSKSRDLNAWLKRVKDKPENIERFEKLKQEFAA